MIILECCEELNIDLTKTIRKLKKDQSIILPNFDLQFQAKKKKADLKLKEEDQQASQSEINKELKYVIQKQLEMLQDEIETVQSDIDKFAFSHLNSNEIIITFGYSITILNCLIKSSKDRNFEVIVVESSIEQKGKEFAQKLAESNITTSLIPETAIYAVAGRANKVFIGAHAIMNNGGAICQSGGLLLAMAAKAFSVPFIVIAAMFKLTPKFPLDQSSYNEALNPGEVFSFTNEDTENLTEVYIDRYNYIEPEYISLFITNFGEHTPAHIYRLFNEYYGKDEYKKIVKEYKLKA